MLPRAVDATRQVPAMAIDASIPGFLDHALQSRNGDSVRFDPFTRDKFVAQCEQEHLDVPISTKVRAFIAKFGDLHCICGTQIRYIQLLFMLEKTA